MKQEKNLKKICIKIITISTSVTYVVLIINRSVYLSNMNVILIMI